ncbi:MAG: hypothetical protein IPK97_00650 [Ahniella sp.]|nr:hypothetical protein [Ahniella sp.]
MKRLTRLLLPALLAALLAGCPNSRSDEKALENTLTAFASEFRWGEDIERVFAYFDPEDADKLRPKPLELERWKQYRVIGYREQPVVWNGENSAAQRTELELVNRHTQITRNLRLTTLWRYDDEAERWYLDSPLPTLSP